MSEVNAADRHPANAPGGQQAGHPLDVMRELMWSRFSCRAYLDKQVPQETIEDILAVAQRTPSWCNSQPWHLTITSGEATKRFTKALYEHASGQPEPAPDFPFPREYNGVYRDRRRESGFQLYNALGIERGDKKAYARQTLENFRAFGAPHVAIVTTEEALGVYGAVDCGAYVASFVLASKAAGVSSIPQAALARCSPFIREYFSLTPDRRVVCGIAFGFADEAHPANQFRTNRAVVDDVVTWVD